MESITGQASDQLRAGIDPVVRLRPRTAAVTYHRSAPASKRTPEGTGAATD